jgi:hypothetical protein
LATPHAALLWDRPAHSILLGSAVEYGILGFGLLVGLWYTQFAQLRFVNEDEGSYDVCIALQAGILGLFVAGLSLDLMLTKYTWIAFAIVALMRTALGARDAELRPIRDGVISQSSRAARSLAEY